MKHISNIRIQLIPAALAWFGFLFLQHLACFDVFDSNLWYLYVLALLFACIHYALLVFLSGKTSCKPLLWGFGGIYAFLSLAKALQILLRHHYDPHSMGLTVVCFLFDILGFLITLYHLRKG